MTWICIVGWIILAVLGAALGSASLSALAPLVLAPMPILLHRKRVPRRPLDLLEPIWIFASALVFTYMVVPALRLTQPSAFSSLAGAMDAPGAQWQAATWIAGGAYLATVVAYFGGAGQRLGTLLPGNDREPSLRRLGLTAGLLFLVGAGITLLDVILSGALTMSPGALLGGQLRERIVASYNAAGFFSVGIGILPLSLPCAALWASSRQGRRRWWLVALLGVLILLVDGFILNTRLLVVLALLSTLVVIHYRARRLTSTFLVTAGTVALVGGILFTITRRTQGVNDLVGAIGSIAITFDGFQWLVNGLARVRHFSWGETLAEDVFVTYFPRLLWADKPSVFGILEVQETIAPGLWDASGHTVSNAPGLVAEGYVTFGLAGAIGLPVITAVVLRAVYERMLTGSAFYVLFGGWLLGSFVSIMRGVGPVIPAAVIALLLFSPVMNGRHALRLPRRRTSHRRRRAGTPITLRLRKERTAKNTES